MSRLQVSTAVPYVQREQPSLRIAISSAPPRRRRMPGFVPAFVAAQKRPLTWLRGVGLRIQSLALSLLSPKVPLMAMGIELKSLAERLGLGERQLRRLFLQHLGASPISVAQTRRVLFAKQLIHETRMPMTEVAMAAGFGSLRRFNETFRDLFHRPPSALRRKNSARHQANGRCTSASLPSTL